MQPLFMNSDRDRPPVSLLTGFLGSGKTTALNHLLRHPSMAQTMVIINEFGEIGLDHELVERSSEEMVLLRSGCLCCTVLGDLIDTLGSIALRRARREIDFDRVVIETTGLADPVPILQTLITDPRIIARFRLDGVITTVDAATGRATLDRQDESARQVAMADRLLLTKTDLVEEGEVGALVKHLATLNPAAPTMVVLNGAVDPDRLFDAGPYDPRAKRLDVRRWLNEGAYAGSTAAESARVQDVNRHDERISALCLTIDRPIAAKAFGNWFDFLATFKGPDLLRVKGILNVVGLASPVVIHGVQHVFHSPVVLDEWPGDDRTSRIVFIGRDLDEKALRDTLTLFSEAAF